MDMEFVQYHPTGIYQHGILMSEACRGEGGYLRNKDGDRFMEKYAPSRWNSPRAIWSAARSSRRSTRGAASGQTVRAIYLDLRHLGREKIMERLPQVRDIALRFVGVDIIDEHVPDPAHRALQHGRHPHRRRRAGDPATRRAHPSSDFTLPGNARASACMARIAWARTACSMRRCSGGGRVMRSPSSSRAARSSHPISGRSGRAERAQRDHALDVRTHQRQGRVLVQDRARTQRRR